MSSTKTRVSWGWTSQVPHNITISFGLSQPFQIAHDDHEGDEEGLNPKDEDMFEKSTYEVFSKARDLGVNRTVHAGEVKTDISAIVEQIGCFKTKLEAFR